MTTDTKAAELLFNAHAAMQDAVEVAEYDTPERTARRVEIVFGLYDDKESEPDDLPFRDVLTDLLHEATRRGVDMEDAMSEALRMWTMERGEWGLDG